MKKWLLLVAGIALITTASVALYRRSLAGGPVQTGRPGVVEQQIVVLRDKNTLFEPNGTVGRALADWLAAGRPGSRTFEFGGHQFDGRSPEATPEAKARLTNLIAMLRAYPEVTAQVFGYTDASANSAADMALGEVRACRVVQVLTSAGISGARLSCAGKGGTNPVGNSVSPIGRAANHRIAITFTIPSNDI
jgi:outer membrane protein OmpA-like peptidoglycan-associated protein